MVLPILVGVALDEIAGALGSTIGQVAIFETVKGPLENLLGGLIPHEKASVRLLMAGYGVGAISREELLKTETFKQLTAEDRNSLLAYGDFLVKKRNDAAAAAVNKAMINEANSHVAKLDALAVVQFDKDFADLEKEIAGIEAQLAALSAEEFKAKQADELAVLDKLGTTLQLALAKQATINSDLLASLPNLSYADFENVAAQALSEYLIDATSGGILPDVTTIKQGVLDTINSKGLLTPTQIKYATDNGYFDQFDAVINSTLASINSAVGATEQA